MIDIYNVTINFDSLYNAGVKHSFSVYTQKKYMYQVLAGVLCV